jgi:diguanylate cyclase (GGDEF)-like protein
MEPELRLLVVEDNVSDAELVVLHIRRAGIACVWRRVETKHEMHQALREFHPDLILADYTLPQFDGNSALALAVAEAPEVPFVFVSGTIGEEHAIAALQRGAVDYIFKSNLSRLVPAVRRAIDEAVGHTARRVAEERIRSLARFDSLTGLLRRALLCDRLTQRLAERDAGALQITVVVFDIERLGAINDSLGRPMGDLLLQSVAERLRQYCDDRECAAHLDGGKFALVMTEAEASEASMGLLYREITEIFGRPLVVAGRDIPAIVRCGFAPPAAAGANAESLVQSAEAALHKAKISALPYMRYHKEMNLEVAERLALEQRLRRALGQNEFLLHYQPQVEQRTGRIIGAEALLRWRDPEQGLVPPSSFLHMLESTELIVPVGEWVLERVAEDCRQWQQNGLGPLRMAINVSPVQLNRRHFGAHFLGLAGSGVWSSFGLEMEITEQTILEDPQALPGTLQILRRAGVRIAIDDFGIGYSSLARLSQLPIDTIKIDRSFTSRLTSDRAGPAIVSTIIALARSLELDTVAEGVETPEQLAMLDALGCAQSQGYLHSPPVPADQFQALLMTNSRGAAHAGAGA